MSKKMGRPKLAQEELRERIVTVRFKGEEFDLIQKAIIRSKRSQSEWIREALVAAARAKKF